MNAEEGALFATRDRQQRPRSATTEPAQHYLRILGLICAVVLWITYGYVTATPGILDRTGAVKGRDFPQFYTVGSLWLEGRSDALQSESEMTAWVREHLPASSTWHLVPVYGPQVALAFAPFALFSYGEALWLWSLASVGLYGTGCWLLIGACPRLRTRVATVWVLAVGSPGLFLTVYYGHLSSVAFLCCAAGYVALKQGNSLTAGLALGSLAYKPQLGLVTGLTFLASRQWRLVTGALAAAAIQAAVALVAAGPGVTFEYLRRLLYLAADASVVQSRNRELNQSLRGLFELALPSSPLGTVAYLTLATVVVVVAYAIWRSRAPLQIRYAAVILASVLASPHFFVYDLVMLMTPLMLLLDVGFRQEHPGSHLALLRAAAVLYISPIAGLFLAIKLHVAGATLAIAGVFLYLAYLSLVTGTEPHARAIDEARPSVATAGGDSCRTDAQ